MEDSRADFWGPSPDREQWIAWSQPEKYTKEYPVEMLEAQRSIGDPEGDAVFAQLMKDGVHLHSPDTDILKEIKMRAEQETLHGPYSAFLAAIETIPSWVDEDLLLQGVNLFPTIGVPIVFVLTCSSLVQSYGASKGASVLVETGRLQEDVVPRIYETGDFLNAIMQPDSLRFDHPGLLAILKVRLLHSAVRHHLLSSTEWDVAEKGVPINNEDMAGTLCLFGPILLHGLRRLGYSLSSEQCQAYYQVWRYVAYLMGVRDPLLPESYLRCVGLANAIQRHQWHPGPHTAALTSALFTSLHIRPNYFLLPASHWRAVAYHLVPSAHHEALGLAPPEGAATLFLHFLCFMVALLSWVHVHVPGAAMFCCLIFGNIWRAWTSLLKHDLQVKMRRY